MSTVRNLFLTDLPNIRVTFGYITNTIRNALGLEKTHYNDAFIIAGGVEQSRIDPISIKQKHKNNRILQKNRNGYKPSIRKQRYPLQPGDVVKIRGCNKKYTVKGVCSYGRSVLVLEQKKSFNPNKINWAYHQKTLMWE